jgi:hypothetical protein
LPVRSAHEISHDPSVLELQIDAVAIQLGFRSAVSNPPFAIEDIAIERIGRLPHTVKKVGHVIRCNAISKMLRHPDRHLVVREIISKKLFEAVGVLNVPNGGAWLSKKD